MNLYGFGLVIEAMLSSLDFRVLVNLKPKVSVFTRLTVLPQEFQIVDVLFQKESHLLSIVLSKFIPVMNDGVLFDSELEGDAFNISLKFCTLNHTLLQIDLCNKNFKFIESISLLPMLKSQDSVN